MGRLLYIMPPMFLSRSYKMYEKSTPRIINNTIYHQCVPLVSYNHIRIMLMFVIIIIVKLMIPIYSLDCEDMYMTLYNIVTGKKKAKLVVHC